MTAGKTRKRRSGSVNQKWRDILCGIPGYDPFAAGGDSWFHEAAAQRALDFFPGCLVHVEGDAAGKPFILAQWETSIVANLFGWKRTDEIGREVLRFCEAFLYLPRKQGKTPFGAGLALLTLLGDSERGQQNYIAAADREQAGKLFRHIQGMIRATPELSRQCKIYGGNAAAGQSKSVVKVDDPLSFIQVISADAHSQHGGNTKLVIVDELHTQPNSRLVDVLITSTASLNRRSTLIVYITTADYVRPSTCNQKYDYACKVRDRLIEDPRFLPVIYEALADEPWDDEETWRKANPNLGVSVSLDYLRRQCAIAKENPAYENEFRRLHLNQRTEQAERVIPMDRWKLCRRDIDPASLRGKGCRAGLDIGATSDFTAFVLLFPEEDAETVTVTTNDDDPDADQIQIMRQSYTLLPFFWLPERPVKRDPRMGDQITAWRRQGFVRTTEGDVVDYDQVLAEIMAIDRQYAIVDIAVDRGFQGAQMSTNLQKAFGDNRIFTFPQGIISMNAPFREFLELVMLGRLHYDGNPVLTWMAGNVAVERRSGLIKPSKDKSPEKIDGITAAVMALGMAMLRPTGSVYEKAGLFTLDGGSEPAAKSGVPMETTAAVQDKAQHFWLGRDDRDED